MHDSSMNKNNNYSSNNNNNNTGHSHSRIVKSKSMSDWGWYGGIGSDFGYEPGYLFDSGLPASGYLFESIGIADPSRGECLAM